MYLGEIQIRVNSNGHENQNFKQTRRYQHKSLIMPIAYLYTYMPPYHTMCIHTCILCSCDLKINGFQHTACALSRPVLPILCPNVPYKYLHVVQCVGVL